MDITSYFHESQHPFHRQYEAMRAFYLENKSAQQVAKQFGYTINAVYSLAQDFKSLVTNRKADEHFFAKIMLGRKQKLNTEEIHEQIITLRKQYLSVEDIKENLDAQGKQVSESYIYHTIKQSGFGRLPRRTTTIKKEVQSKIDIKAPKTSRLLINEANEETFSSSNVGVLCFLSYIQQYGIDQLINRSKYPGTKTLPKLNSILSFAALKLSNIKRYTQDDLWCMDRGLGIFAGLNVLPKAAWFSSYSHRITREMNIDFLKSLYKLWIKEDLISDTTNLDFKTIPCWGDDSHLENNWSGTRHQALSSILAAVSQDPESGLITYGDANVTHKNESNIVVEFLDFYSAQGQTLKYLVFDSKFTTYENLSRLDDRQIKFLTIRRRGKNIVSEVEALPKSNWKNIRVPAGDGKTRQLKVYDHTLFLRGYGKKIRQIAITGHGRIKPALIITNDFELAKEKIIRKYARRWLVEKSISEQTHFFHLNRVSSSMVIKVDFDLTMTILAYNLYRLLALNLSGYSHHTAEKIYEKFIQNGGKIQITKEEVIVFMKKKRHLPAILSAMRQLTPVHIPFIDKNLTFIAASYS